MKMLSLLKDYRAGMIGKTTMLSRAQALARTCGVGHAQQSNRYGLPINHTYSDVIHQRVTALRSIGEAIAKALKDESEYDMIEALNDLRHNAPNNFDQRFDQLKEIWAEKVGCDLDAHRCGDCGTVHAGDESHTDIDDNIFCDDCRDNYRWSEYHGNYIHEDAAMQLFQGARAWRNDDPDYISERAGDRNFRQNPDDSNQYLDDEAWQCAVENQDFSDYDYDEEDEYEPASPSTIGSYHSARHFVGHILSDKYSHRTPRVLMGLELEVEVDGRSDQDNHALAREMVGILNTRTEYNYCAVERDGSIDNGFEIVTGYTGLDKHEEHLKVLQSMPFAQRLKSHDTTTCGLHVHIDKAQMSMFHASKLMMFMHEPSNERLLRAVARRYGYNSGFAKFKDKTKGEANNQYRNVPKHVKHLRDNGLNTSHVLRALNGDRYEAINFQPERTVEYRLFRGTLKFETIMACLEFTWLTYHFTKMCSLHELTTVAFLNYIARPENAYESRYLRPLLVAKGFMSSSVLIPLDAEAAPAKELQAA